MSATAMTWTFVLAAGMFPDYRGPYCVYADDAVRQLEASGYRARRLEDGYPQWQQDELPTAVGS